ncbi:hypothetical protein FNV43_RR03011 [Rhamnella rubrinervis]|uniref:Uncharacterized protein n=1 Tax=Rhamnella rubrinervis TaxID=2594499 RepID=A0A8K0HJ38_9ROSA|nr:hypothetical protein FNV43_RR03011 [Rhamnella rubrinervis]
MTVRRGVLKQTQLVSTTGAAGGEAEQMAVDYRRMGHVCRSGLSACPMISGGDRLRSHLRRRNCPSQITILPFQCYGVGAHLPSSSLFGIFKRPNILTKSKL